MGAGKKRLQGILLCLAFLVYTLVESSTESSLRTDTSTVPATTTNNYSSDYSETRSSPSINTTQTISTQTLTTQTCHVENCKICDSGSYDSCELCEDDYHKTDGKNSSECVCKTICHSCHGLFWVCITVPVVGGVILIAIVIGIIFCVRRYKKTDPPDTSSLDDVRQPPPSKDELDNVQPVYENVPRTSATKLKKGIEEGHEKLTRYARDPTINDKLKVTGEISPEPSQPQYPRDSTFYEPVDHLELEVRDEKQDDDVYEPVDADDSDYVNGDELRKLATSKDNVDDDTQDQGIYENTGYKHDQVDGNVYYNEFA